jgi:hypothetical protein
MSDKHIDIVTLRDIVEKIPLEKMPHFLEDLKRWIALTATAKLLSFGEFGDAMRWIDDGKHDATINVTYQK